MGSPVTIRDAREEDAPALAAIYRHYVEKTAVTFDETFPDDEAFAEKIRETKKTHPFLAAEEGDGRILGYAYAHPFVGRAAYRWSAETTIYLAPDAKRRGIGRALYGDLEERLRAMGILTLYACIGVPREEREEDGILTFDSVRFHEKMGYRTVGTFSCCAYKFGRWLDMSWMEKRLAPLPFPDPPREIGKPE